jgi:hypothetical protein
VSVRLRNLDETQTVLVVDIAPTAEYISLTLENPLIYASFLAIRSEYEMVLIISI